MARKKILIVASSGGHLEEALALRKLKEYYDTVLITERTDYKVNCWQDTIYLMPQVNRKELKSLVQYVGCFLKLFKFCAGKSPT